MMLINAVPLYSIGSGDWATYKKDTFLLLNYLEKEKILILGGDVLIIENSIIKHWSTDQIRHEDREKK